MRSDVERKALFGVAETARLPQQAYTPEANRRVYDTLLDNTRRILSAGHSAIVDAVFARPDERAALARLARSSGVGLCGLFLTADLASRLDRVGGRAADASDAGRDVAQAQEDYDLGTLDWRQIDASGTTEDTLARAQAALD